MANLKNRSLCVMSLTLMMGASAANAQWAVVDVGAIAQLIQQVQVMQQQLTAAQDHLMQARQEYRSITGSRGMERLLGDTARNYLPADWTQLVSTAGGSGGAYGDLAAGIRGAITANSVLSPAQLALLSPAERQQIEVARQTAAMQQAMAREALATTSNRFASIQRLIDAIPAAGDQKAILDLQARIGAEQGMLQNEQTKLQVLFQAAQAEARANLGRERERVIASHGRFATRFRPAP